MPSVHSKEPDPPGPPPLRVGASYATFIDFQKALKAYEVKCSVPYVVNGSILVSKYNQDKGTNFNSDLKYFRAKFTCKHFGKPRTSGKGIRPNQSTFKSGCQSCVIIQADNETNKLVVQKFDQKHSHPFEADEADVNFYPEFRRKGLDKDALEEAEWLLSLNVPSIELQDYISTKEGKILSIQDIDNMRNKLKSEVKSGRNDTEELFDELESLLQSNPGSKVIYGCDQWDKNDECDERDENNENDGNVPKEKKPLSYLFFQTAEMAQDFDNFNDVLIADSTYCTNKYEMPLMVFQCLDSNGNGRVAGYCLLKDESQQTVKLAVAAFLKAHPKAKDTIKTVLIDKDYNERVAFREALPDALIHICLFHSLQIFNRKTQGEENKDELRALLEKIVYSSTKEIYDELYEELCEIASSEFLNYYEENWHNCQDCWTSYQRTMSLNNGQSTTNVTESHNQKIKAILKRKSSMAEVVRKLLQLHTCKNTAVALRTFNAKVKIRYITNNDDPIIEEILNSTTPFVGELLRVQYNWAMEKASIPETQQDISDLEKCSCKFFKSFRLPCSHIFLGRLRAGEEIFDPEMIPLRWRHNASVREVSNESVAMVSNAPVKVGGKPLSEDQRYRKVIEVTTRLTKLTYTCGGQQFKDRLNVLEKVATLFEKKKDVFVMENSPDNILLDQVMIPDVVDVESEVLVSEPHEDNASNAENESTEPKRNKNMHAGFVKKADQYKVLDPKVRSTITLPVGHVPKGRPKGKVRPTAIGRKRKATKDQPSKFLSDKQSEEVSVFAPEACQCVEDPTVPLKLKCQNGGPNHGRFFYTCPKDQGKKCKFFEWDTHVLPVSKNTTPNCDCGDPCMMRKDPDKKIFYGCWKFQCKFIQWVASKGEPNRSNTRATPPSEGSNPIEIVTIDSDDESVDCTTAATTTVKCEVDDGIYGDLDMDAVSSLMDDLENGKLIADILEVNNDNPCIICRDQGPPTPQTGHKCFLCGTPVHAFGCSVERGSGEQGFGGSDRLCLQCSRKEPCASGGEVISGGVSNQSYQYSSPMALKVARNFGESSFENKEPLCFGCKKPLTRHKSRQPKNLGREFYGCQNGETDSCQFFKYWAPASKKESSLKSTATIQKYFSPEKDPGDEEDCGQNSYLTQWRRRHVTVRGNKQHCDTFEMGEIEGNPILSSTLLEKSPEQGRVTVNGSNPDPLGLLAYCESDDEDVQKKRPRREHKLPARLANSYHLDSLTDQESL